MSTWLLLHWNLLSIPFIAALIGWVTNFIAIKMLFRPRKPRNLLGLRLVGLIPKRQSELAIKIGQAIERDLLSHRDVQAAMQSPEVEQEIKNLIQDQVDIFLNKTIGRIPMVSMVLQGSLALQIKELLVQQLHSATPAMIDGLVSKLEHKLNFQQIVQQKIEAFDLAKLEEIIYHISAKELKTIELLGGVLGFVVGLAQVAFILLTGS